jgi:hypothetical protein
LAVEEFDLARGIQGTHTPRNVIDEQAELAFALTYRFLRAPSLIDIRLQNAPTDDASFRAPNRETLDMEPPVDAIRAQLADFHVVWLPAVH